MQLRLKWTEEAEEAPEQVPPRLEVWRTLGPEQRNELLDQLARLLAKVATASAASSPPQARKEEPDE